MSETFKIRDDALKQTWLKGHSTDFTRHQFTSHSEFYSVSTIVQQQYRVFRGLTYAASKAEVRGLSIYQAERVYR